MIKVRRIKRPTVSQVLDENLEKEKENGVY